MAIRNLIGVGVNFVRSARQPLLLLLLLLLLSLLLHRCRSEPIERRFCPAGEDCGPGSGPGSAAGSSSLQPRFGHTEGSGWGQAVGLRRT